MPMKPGNVCTCGRVRPAGQACLCGVGDAAKRKAYYDAKRGTAAERGYDSRWRKQREAFLKEHRHCEWVDPHTGRTCGRWADVVDHVTPHKGDPDLFWRITNWQALCTHHHCSDKQAQERVPTPRFPTLARPPGDRRVGKLPNSSKTAIFRKVFDAWRP